MLLNSGDVFAGFTIERLLGEGGMGAVYLARHPRLGKQTALKLLKPELFADAAIRTRFERESDLAAALDHPSIVTVYDRGAEGEHLWMCMQYVDGADASTVNPMTLPPDKAVQIVTGIADALDYAHGQGVLHRDVKPSNVLLARAGQGQGERVFLTDFGLARLRAETVRLTQTGMFTATLAFASPEQMTGGDMDGRSDQYSLACTLYWLLTGMAPFDSPNPADIIHGNLQLAPPPLAVKRRGLPPGLDAVLATAMAKHPAHRYRTCADFAAAAEYAVKSAVDQRPPPAAPPQPVAPPQPAAPPQPVVPPQPAGAPPAGPSAEPTEGPAVPGATDAAPADRADPHRTVAITRPAPPAATPGSAVEQTDGFGAVSATDRHGSAKRPNQGEIDNTGGIPVVPGGRSDTGATGYPGESVEHTGTTPAGRPGGYPPGANYPAQPVGYAAPGAGTAAVRRTRGAWIAIAILVPLIVIAVVAAVAVVLLGADGSDSGGAAAAPQTTSNPAATGDSGPGDRPDGEPGERTRRLFPHLLPQGSGLDGYGYQDSLCSRFGPDERRRIPLLPELPVFDDVLNSRPWKSIWDCRLRELQPGAVDYTILTYPEPEVAREVIGELPAHEVWKDSKAGEPFTAHIWEDPDARGRFTVNMLVSFGSDEESPRSTSLLFVRKWGTTAHQDIRRWWSDAPL